MFDYRIIDNSNRIIGEGPIWNSFESCLYYVDSYKKQICKFDWKTGNATELIVPDQIRSLNFTKDGQMLLTYPDSVSYMNKKGETTKIDLHTKVEKLDFNDSKVGPDGRLYISNMSNDGTGGILRLDFNGNLVQLCSGSYMTNGLDWSPDGKQFYFADTTKNHIRIFDFDYNQLKEISEPIDLNKIGVGVGPDGMTVDSEGMIWVAMWGAGKIIRTNPIMKKMIGFAKIPAKNVASCAFAGKNLDKLIVTTASLDTDIATNPLAGNTFCININCKGKLPFLFGQMTAKISDIKRFAVHDGDGIRTTVFFKGCPLKCKWCHNPESIYFQSQIGHIEKKCISCGECAKVCGAHSIKNGKHIFEREKCIGCGRCEKVCLGEALKFYGKEITVDELLPVLLEDKDFYDNSNGGVTLSGGECLCQADFCLDLIKRLKENNIHTAIDTCGFVSKNAIDKVMPYTDIFLYDIKAFDEQIHIECTGQSNKIILENLKYIDDCGKLIEIRIPYIPKCNSDQIDKIGKFLSGFKNITKIKILPYHNYAGSKYKSLDMENTMQKIELPTTEQITEAVHLLKSYGLNVVNEII